MPLTGIFLLSPNHPAHALLTRLHDVFPQHHDGTTTRPFSLKHTLHRSVTDTPTQAPTSSVLQILTLSTQPGCTIISISQQQQQPTTTGVATQHKQPPPPSSIKVPATSSAGIAAFSQLMATKMSAIWTPARQYDLAVLPSSAFNNNTNTAGVENGALYSGGGGRIMQVGAFEVCVSEIVSSVRGGEGVSQDYSARGVRGVVMAVRLGSGGDEVEEEEGGGGGVVGGGGTSENNGLSTEEQEQQKGILRDFRILLDLKRLDEGAPGPDGAVVDEEFWGEVGDWRGEAALWCEVLRSRALGSVVRKNEVGR